MVWDSMIITKILLTLPSNLNHFACAWESLSEEQRTLANLTSRLTIEEARTNSQEKPTESALAAKARQGQYNKGDRFRQRRRPGECYKCGKKGHCSRECRSKEVKLDKEEDENKRRKSKPEQSEALIGAEDKQDEESEEKWYLDTGASAHMTSNKDWLSNYVEFKKPKHLQ